MPYLFPGLNKNFSFQTELILHSFVSSERNIMKICYAIITGIFILTAVDTAFCQSKKEERKIIDVHFHALKWNSFGNPPPPNEITGVVPIAMSDTEEQSIMLA